MHALNQETVTGWRIAYQETAQIRDKTAEFLPFSAECLDRFRFGFLLLDLLLRRTVQAYTQAD